jgi:flagellar basal body-associated protein FliL
METLTIKFHPNIKAKILELLSSFSSDELKIVQGKETFEEEKRMLQSRIDKINDGTAVYSTFEELDILLETTISKYED